MNSQLYHHGIKGQKWGVRRFQNADGTRTEAGAIRYGSQSKKQKTPVSGAKEVVSGLQKLSNLANEQPRNRYDTRKILTQKEMNRMSNKELQELVTRLNLEQQYSMLTADRASRRRVDTGLKYAEAILTIAGGALTIAAAYRQLKS